MSIGCRSVSRSDHLAFYGDNCSDAVFLSMALCYIRKTSTPAPWLTMTEPTNDSADPTRTEQTEAAYEKRHNQLIAAAAAALGLPAGTLPDPISYAQWLLDQRTRLARASFRVYRASAIHALSLTDDPRAETALALLRETPSPAVISVPKRTSARKAKRLPDADRFSLMAWLRRRSSKWGGVAAQWLMAGYLTGLRPSEWRQSRFIEEYGEDKVPALEVENAKHTNGRAHGPTRVLVFSDLPEEAVGVVRKFSELVTTRTNEYPLLHQECSRILRRANHDLFPKARTSYTLYSARHEFAANAKAIFQPEEVAALMGHVSRATAYEHYGRPNRGGGGYATLPVPNPADVAAVAAAGRGKSPTRAPREEVLALRQRARSRNGAG